MARRKQQRAVTRETKIRLPEDIAKDIEAESTLTGVPINRIVINRLGMFDGLRQHGGKLGELMRDLEIMFAKQNARNGSLELSEQLLAAVDNLLKAEGSAAAMDKLRAARAVMLKREQDDKKLMEKLEAK